MIFIASGAQSSVLLKFSRKNLDVADILDKVSKDANKTDYICEAVRFYFKFKGKLQSENLLTEATLEEKFEELFYKYMNAYVSKSNIKNNTFDLSEISKTDLEDD